MCYRSVLDRSIANLSRMAYDGTSSLDGLKALKDLKLTSNDGKHIVPTLIKLFTEFQASFLAKMDEMKSEFIDLCSEKDRKITDHELKIKCLEQKVSSLEDKIDEGDAYERRDTLIISGDKVPVFTIDENCSQKVIDTLRTHLNYVLPASEISVAHRIGPPPASQAADKRNFIIKLCKRSVKKDILTAARTMKVNNLYIQESLTPQRRTIAFVLRKAKRSFPLIISGTGSQDGSVIVWVKPPNPNAPGAKNSRVVINNVAKLQDFCTRTLGKAISEIVPDIRI